MLSGRTFERMIMDYELAKQLKDAEFPEVGSGFLHSEKTWPDELYIPTLSELIEACGEPFRGLTKKHTAQWDWWASAYRNGAIVCGGNAADEAAARLWLALNAKAV